MFGTLPRRFGLVACLLVSFGVLSALGPQAGRAASTQSATATDARADAIAHEVMEALGGQQAWDKSRYVSWLFFGRRQHYWDRWTGDVRIETDDTLILMNIQTRQGRVWEGGVEVTVADSLAPRLEKGYAWWINDSYWTFMPYKLKDDGVLLRYVGQRDMQNGRPADVLELTFENVGRTPENKYEVCVDKETRLIGEWTFYRNAADAEPAFTSPWADWKRVGNIMLAGSHGRDQDWKLAVYDELPRAVFESPDPVQLENAAR